MYFSPSGGWNSKVMSQTDVVRGPPSRLDLLPVPAHGGRGQGALWSLFYQGANPIHGDPSLMA